MPFISATNYVKEYLKVYKNNQDLLKVMGSV
jgi:hypothetical protein